MARRKTHEEFVKEVEDKFGKEYQFLTMYKNSKTEVKVRHLTCGEIIHVKADSLLRSKGCPFCLGSKKSTSTFKKEIFALFGNEYVVLGEYQNTHEKIRLKHSKCGFEFLITPRDFVNRNRRCPVCSKGRVKDTEIYKLQVFNLVGEEYDVLGEYIGDATHISTRHNKCGHIYDTTPSNFLQGYRCSKCNIESRGKKLAKTTLQFKQEVYDIVKDEYDVLGEYKNIKTHILMRHNVCGYQWEALPGSFLKNHCCPDCSAYHKNTAKFKAEVYELTGDEYHVLGEYKGSHTHTEMLHRNCGHKWSTAPTTFLNGSRCPRCQSSKGERIVEDILIKNDFTYTTQDWFENCKNERVLPFDFGVYVNDDLVALIEYQGEQHYKPVDFGSKGDAWAKDQFEKRQVNDSIKRNFCKLYGIPLIEIKYTLTDKEISELLTSELNKCRICKGSC